jgi:hypothetical protein
MGRKKDLPQSARWVEERLVHPGCCCTFPMKRMEEPVLGNTSRRARKGKRERKQEREREACNPPGKNVFFLLYNTIYNIILG